MYIVIEQSHTNLALIVQGYIPEASLFFRLRRTVSRGSMLDDIQGLFLWSNVEIRQEDECNLKNGLPSWRF
jgi:hypothetical protein